MKMMKRLAAAAISSAIMLSMASVQTFAATVTQDGLNVTLAADKAEYDKDESITATLTVENTGTEAVTNVSLETVIPDGYKLDKGSDLTKQAEKLNAGDKTDLVVTYVADSQASDDSKIDQSSVTSEVSDNSASSSDNSVANTGNNIFSVVLSLILLCVSAVLIFIFVKKKKGKAFLSVAVCISVLGAIIAVVPFGTKAADNSKTISITETIIIDGKELNINAFVKYDLKGNNQQSSENSENNNNSIEKDIIKGSLSKTLDCIINNEFNSDFHYLSMYGDIKEQLIENEIPSSLAKNVSYEIGNIEITQDDQSDTYAVIDVTFNSVDMIRLLSNIDNEETYRSLIIDKLNNKDYVEKVFDVKLIMIKIEDLWHLYETEQLDDVFMGGLYSLDMDLQDEYFKELNGGNENG